MSIKTILFSGYKIPILNDLNDLIIDETKLSINTVNPYSYTLAKGDSTFSAALKNCDILLPDGMGIVIAVWLMHGIWIPKVTGPEMHRFLLQLGSKRRWRIFYLGSSSQTLDLIHDRISCEYPKVVSGSYSPPYMEVFSEEDDQAMIDAINNFSPDVLFVGMTAPKQEKWVERHRDRINARIICTIGAAFDYYAGTVRQPPKWMRKLWLEWLHRIITQPRHMWKRYKKFPFTNVLIDVAKAKFHGTT
jgi:N-acetylglucosaminyldiphosphoundecaprenol N-acetyl-beta-D-mannosaminyltransferase